jgi:hypothetical protein
MRQLQSITTQGLANSTLPDNQHQETQDLAATQHQHQAINTRASKTEHQRSSTPGNRRQENINTRQSTPGQVRGGSNAPHHKTIDTRAGKPGQQRSTAPGKAKQHPAATQHNTRQGQATSGSNAAQHQAISARRTLTPGNQHQAKQEGAATHHITRQLTPRQASQGNNAAQH